MHLTDILVWLGMFCSRQLPKRIKLMLSINVARLGCLIWSGTSLFLMQKFGRGPVSHFLPWPSNLVISPSSGILRQLPGRPCTRGLKTTDWPKIPQPHADQGTWCGSEPLTLEAVGATFSATLHSNGTSQQWWWWWRCVRSEIVAGLCSL